MAAAYLEWMRVQNFSRYTVQSRDYDLRRFLDWSEERSIVRTGDVTKIVLEDYKKFQYRRKKPDGSAISRTTQHHTLRTIRGFTKWLHRRGVILTDPGAFVELPRLEQHLPPTALTPLEVEQILGAIDVTQLSGLRDRTILEVAYSTGMRRLELSRLKINDVDADRGTVMVRQGKGKKDRVVPIGARALAWLDKYLEESRPFLLVGAEDDGDGTVFLTRFGTAIAPNSITDMGRMRVKAAGLEKPGSMHIYRHSAATGMLEGGADIRVIQEFLGHSRLDTTQIYTQVAIQTLKQVHGKTHPAERPRAAAAAETPKPRVVATDDDTPTDR